MKPIKFKGHNVVIAEDQPQYLPLPAYREKGELEGIVVFCEKMTWGERFKALFTGKIWCTVMTFGQPFQPIFMSTNQWRVFNKKNFKKIQND